MPAASVAEQPGDRPKLVAPDSPQSVTGSQYCLQSDLEFLYQPASCRVVLKIVHALEMIDVDQPAASIHDRTASGVRRRSL